MFGEIDATSTCVNFHDAAALLMPAVGNAHTSGDIVSLETGEVLVLVQDGNVTHISPETLTEMLDAIFEVDPEAAIGLALLGLMVFSEGEAPAESDESEDEFMNLLEILSKL
jgi:hypothetical protein